MTLEYTGEGLVAGAGIGCQCGVYEQNNDAFCPAFKSTLAESDPTRTYPIGDQFGVHFSWRTVSTIGFKERGIEVGLEHDWEVERIGKNEHRYAQPS
ncbi:MAG TPA: hypothetical protein PLX89_07295 [Verrucomicrobiota bacterium]|nr:hypothetical protein [Verrucomicrobiota bacterium]